MKIDLHEGAWVEVDGETYIVASSDVNGEVIYVRLDPIGRDHKGNKIHIVFYAEVIEDE